MTAGEAIAYIENYTWSTTRLGLDRTRALLAALGDPQKKLKFIHVAGSNGKGSTCAMLDSVLRRAGYRTGLYTSPYIEDFCERMRINGENIPGEALARLTERVRVLADAMEDHPSQFELVTAIAMQYFYEQRCDIVVLEVGMGGELDSTNVIDFPEAAVITNIGLEHTEYLGNSLTEIASAKGGIIKPGCTAVCYECGPEVEARLREICREKNAVYVPASEAALRHLRHDLSGQRFLWKGEEYFIPLLGEHQLRNAGVVLETCRALRERGWALTDAAVKEGLKLVRWPARFELLSREPLFILDGGHNPQCAQALAKSLGDYLPGEKLSFLMGVLRDKDYAAMIDLVAPYAAAFLCVTPDSPRALTGGELAAEIRKKGFPASACDSIEDGIAQALASGGPVAAFGSLYMAGRVRTLFPGALKKQQRKQALAARSALPAEVRQRKSQNLCRRIGEGPEYKQAGTILVFKAFGSEPDLSALEARAAADGKTVLYPCCVDMGEMLALRPKEGAAWTTDRCGIAVPVREDADVFPPEQIDLIICPCAAFDDAGRRLGMGAGCYDRFLPRCEKAVFLLAAFEEQRLERVCTESFDQKMNVIYTDKKTFSAT